MRRIIFVPQYPTPMRYQEWWFWQLPYKFHSAGFDVKILGEKYVKSNKIYAADDDSFSPVQNAIDLETHQIREYMDLKLRKDDILFLADLSFPGFFANVLYHKRPILSYAFCHATSLNTYDYFKQTRHSKASVEIAHTRMFENVFVGSYYHQGKLDYAGFTDNIKVIYLPLPPPQIIYPIQREKKRLLTSVSRVSQQKVNKCIEEAAEQQYNTKIYRKKHKTWEDYCKTLSESQILLVSANEETFGYQVVDAIMNNCIPVVPDDFSYPELVDREYRYRNTTELFDIIDNILTGDLPVPELRCKTGINNFYDNIIKIMRKERVDYPI